MIAYKSFELRNSIRLSMMTTPSFIRNIIIDNRGGAVCLALPSVGNEWMAHPRCSYPPLLADAYESVPGQSSSGASKWIHILYIHCICKVLYLTA